tara:strand:+ start:158 stop:586 length:429 start_codon:yes stop_codon:yes gene_type:complete
LSFKKLKDRIKKNEGYSDKPYKDQLGFYTIGYGHLIKEKENNYYIKKYNKDHFKKLFEADFKKAQDQYQKNFFKKYHTISEKELLIEMLFQLGENGVSKFKKMLYFLNKKEKFMASLEMLDSLWYLQTPERVKNLIKNYTKK